MYRRFFVFLLLLAASSLQAFPQAWSGILAPSRAVDWSTAGVQGGIPSGSWTQSGSTISSGASTSTIQSALNACSGNHYVLLGSGSFSLSNSLAINTSGCELRGSGPTSTTITLNGHNILMGDGSGNQGTTPGGLGVTNLNTLTPGKYCPDGGQHFGALCRSGSDDLPAESGMGQPGRKRGQRERNDVSQLFGSVVLRLQHSRGI